MSQLLRGVERSRCALRASSRAFSTGRSASAIRALGLIPQQAKPTSRPRCAVASVPVAFRSSSAHSSILNDATVLSRNFSSLNTSADTSPSSSETGDGKAAQNLAHFATTQLPPSALEQANLAEVTPGLAIFVLQKHASKSMGGEIRQTDFIKLCESARRCNRKDGKIIATALNEFKRYNNFIIETIGARAAVEGMLRAMRPQRKVQNGKPRLMAATFVGDQILDEKSGLYFAVETALVNKVLQEVHESLAEMKKNGKQVSIAKADEGSKEEPSADIDEESKEEPSAEEKLLSDALRVTEGMVKLLIKRRARPERDMKKRAKRNYLKTLQVGSGPNMETLKLASQISILMGGSAAARENIIAPYEDAWFSKPIDGTALQVIEKAEAKELQQQEAADAAAAAAAAEVAAAEAAAAEAAAAEAAAAEAAEAEAAAVEAAAAEAEAAAMEAAAVEAAAVEAAAAEAEAVATEAAASESAAVEAAASMEETKDNEEDGSNANEDTAGEGKAEGDTVVEEKSNDNGDGGGDGVEENTQTEIKSEQEKKD